MSITSTQLARDNAIIHSQNIATGEASILQGGKVSGFLTTETVVETSDDGYALECEKLVFRSDEFIEIDTQLNIDGKNYTVTQRLENEKAYRYFLTDARALP